MKKITYYDIYNELYNMLKKWENLRVESGIINDKRELFITNIVSDLFKNMILGVLRQDKKEYGK